MRKQQQAIIEALKVKSTIDPKAEIRLSIEFIKDYLKTYPGMKTLVLGISGGQDSTLAGRLAQLAVEEMRQETGKDDYRFITVRLPYGTQADEADAQLALSFIQPDESLAVNIKLAVDQEVTALEDSGIKISDYNKGNIKARQRMITQYAIAGARHGVVIGTDHAAEALTGFYTKFGDGAADITPLWRLDKGQGRQLLQALNCPPALYEKTPTADLEEDLPQRPDEEALGVTYQVIDQYLEGHEVSKKDAETIEAWYQKTEHKRHLPINVYDDWWQGK
ncbi:MAG: ammonia-dependent NAD(+) synthetase [Aerococcus sp.]|nr:ammonia-dependent NAD(+) synthetase [Aerococcus sp.]